MNREIAQDLYELTSTISNPQTKPILRSTIALGLRDLGHDPAEVEEALNEFYHETVH